jgi:hypothetical protein
MRTTRASPHARALHANGQLDESIALPAATAPDPASSSSPRSSRASAATRPGLAARARDPGGAARPELRARHAGCWRDRHLTAAQAERQLAALIEGRPRGDTVEGQLTQADDAARSLDELVASCGQAAAERAPRSRSARASPPTWLSWLWRRVRYAGLDRDRIEASLRTAVEARFGKSFLGAEPAQELAVHIDRLRLRRRRTRSTCRPSRRSTSAATDAIFVARVLADRPFEEPLCEPGDFAIERCGVLSGATPSSSARLEPRLHPGRHDELRRLELASRSASTRWRADRRPAAAPRLAPSRSTSLPERTKASSASTSRSERRRGQERARRQEVEPEEDEDRHVRLP